MFYVSVRNEIDGWHQHGPFATEKAAKAKLSRELSRKDLPTVKGCIIGPDLVQRGWKVRKGWS